MYCTIFGPELAIRGAEHEQKRAIRGLYDERRRALKLFWLGCAAIVLSGGALGWLKYPEASAILISMVFAVLIGGSSYYVKTILAPLFKYVDAEGLDCSELVADDGAGARQSASSARLRRASEWFFKSTEAAGHSHAESAENTPADDLLLPRSALLHLLDQRVRAHGLLRDGLLRIFSVDGNEMLPPIDLAQCSIEIEPNMGAAFLLKTHDGAFRQRCAGATLAETQRWIRALVTHLDEDAVDVAGFEEHGV
ncbi:hypothetical protein M885DRAFT_520750 [Pelagophyceae sp. CCMP2097]|nr:hypothetical protein M885DRAFT_520750 [Pelagophyceae sp. CCMP2097]